MLFVGHAREIFPVHLLNSFHFAADCGNVRGEFVDGLLETFFFGCRFKNEQAFVSFHFSFPSVVAPLTGPLYWLIAFCIPAVSQHSAWSAAKVKTLSIIAASVELNRLSTWPVIS